MSNADSSEDGWSRARKINAAGWIVGGFLILFGIVSILSLGEGGVVDAIRSVVGGAIFVAGGLLALPKTREYVVTPLSETTGLQISGVMVAGLVLLAFVAGAGALPTPDQEADTGTQALEASEGTPEATATDVSSGEEMTATDGPEDASDGAELTPTATPVSSEVSGSTATMTATPTKRSTATATATATAIPTATATPAPTATATPRPTATPTATPTPSPTPTATPEPSSSDVALDVIQYTDDGNDNDYPNNEWVQFENQGEQAVSLSGWTVKDDSSTWSYDFGSVTLNPGDTVRLYTGEGSDTNSEVYWGYKRAVWNDDGDVVRLIDDDGELIVEFAYDGDSADGRASPN